MDSYKVQDVVPFEGRFPSWEAFDVARKAHCEKTHTLYVCRNTVKVAIANKRRKLQVPDSWVYDRKVRRNAPRTEMKACEMMDAVVSGRERKHAYRNGERVVAVHGVLEIVSRHVFYGLEG
jgi:hypothetical protein